ncbi:unnamed protein product [Phytophthora fragariaefolia]|uniref:Unnamed protein product n=1 Tax=Phytophthora fragariaefolia TaxID=1490495 RepID=A0A9W6YRR2_9STRA|nr:unnamed protein product [Phytophthora fragariaefolia]
MNPSQASSDDSPRLIGADNFDARKTRVCAALDGKHILGYVQKPDYDGISEEERDDSASDVSDSDGAPKPKSSESSDVVAYDEEIDKEKPKSNSDEEFDDNSETSAKQTKLPVTRPFNRRRVCKERKHGAKVKLLPLNPRERR